MSAFEMVKKLGDAARAGRAPAPIDCSRLNFNRDPPASEAECLAEFKTLGETSVASTTECAEFDRLRHLLHPGADLRLVHLFRAALEGPGDGARGRPGHRGHVRDRMIRPGQNASAIRAALRSLPNPPCRPSATARGRPRRRGWWSAGCRLQLRHQLQLIVEIGFERSRSRAPRRRRRPCRGRPDPG